MPSTRSGTNQRKTMLSPRSQVAQRRSGATKEAAAEVESPEPLATQLVVMDDVEDDSNGNEDIGDNDNTMAQEHPRVPPVVDAERESAGEQTETDDDDNGKQQAASTTRNPTKGVRTPKQRTPRMDDDDVDNADDDMPAVRQADRMIFDLLDYELEIMLRHQEDRSNHIEVVVDLIKGYYAHNNLEFGRIHVRTLFVTILADVVTELPRNSLVKWSPVEWQELATDLLTAHNAYSRNDAVVRVVTGQETADSDVVVSRYEETQTLQQVLQLVELHRILAPIRYKLIQRMEKGETGTPRVKAEKLQAVLDQALASDETSLARRYIPRLFVNANGGEDEAADQAKRSPVLHNLEDLEVFLSKKKQLNLAWFQKQVERLVMEWNVALYGTTSQDVTLYHLNYHKASDKPEKPNRQKNRLSNQTTPRRRIARLQADRQALETSHGDDPLEESRVVAAHAVGAEPPKRRVPRKVIAKKTATALYRPKRSAHALQFEEDDNEKNNAENTPKRSRSSTGTPGDAPRVQLSNVPDSEEFQATVERAKAVATESKKYEGPAPDSGLFDAMGNVTRRQRWTDEETNAIRCGLEEFGPGNWVKIRNRYCDVLKNRTTVQIKDRFRTLKKRGELPFEYLASE